MGWRLGQGVGPRVSAAKLKQQDAQLSALPSEVVPLPEIDVSDEAVKHTFAPRDSKIPIYSTKDNFFGLEYSSGVRLHSDERGRVNTTNEGPNISGMFTLAIAMIFEDLCIT
jgi:G patch domain-containing protein 1